MLPPARSGCSISVRGVVSLVCLLSILYREVPDSLEGRGAYDAIESGVRGCCAAGQGSGEATLVS